MDSTSVSARRHALLKMVLLMSASCCLPMLIIMRCPRHVHRDAMAQFAYAMRASMLLSARHFLMRNNQHHFVEAAVIRFSAISRRAMSGCHAPPCRHYPARVAYFRCRRYYSADAMTLSPQRVLAPYHTLRYSARVMLQCDRYAPTPTARGIRMIARYD